MNVRRFLNPRALLPFTLLTLVVTAIYTRSLGGEEQTTSQWLLLTVGLTAALVILTAGVLVLISLLNGGGLAVGQARRLDAAGDSGAALTRYNELLQGGKANPEALVGRAALLIAQDDLHPALDDLNQAISNTPHVINFPDPLLYRAYMERGRVREMLGDREGALEDWGRALRIAPHQPEVYLLRGRAEVESGHYYNGQDDLTQAIRIATALLNGAGQDRAVSAAMLNLRGMAYTLIGQPHRAISDFESALKLDPLAWAAHYNLAGAYVALGQNEPALAALGEALRLNPAAAVAARRSAAFRSLRGDPLFEGLLAGARRAT